MNNIEFRKKIFKGAGIEDILNYCNLLTERHEQLSSEQLEKVLEGDAQAHYREEFHRGMATMAEQIKMQIIHQFKYEGNDK